MRVRCTTPHALVVIAIATRSNGERVGVKRVEGGGDSVKASACRAQQRAVVRVDDAHDAVGGDGEELRAVERVELQLHERGVVCVDAHAGQAARCGDAVRRCVAGQ